MKRILTAFIGFSLTISTYSSGVLSATSFSEDHCQALLSLDFSSTVGTDVTLRSAERINPDEVWLPDHCRVHAIIAPSTGVEIQLPLSGWNERLLFTGCGGLCGAIRTEQGLDALARNYAVATTDMGHQLKDNDDPRAWTVNQDLVVEWQYRATHRATLLAKAVIDAAYNQSQDYAYFRGCSTGGRQGLTEALMFPDDYDGIIAGAPAMEMVTPHNVFAYASNTRTDGSPILTKDSLILLADAVLEACDMNDGVKDGVIPDPLACKFEPSSLQCSASQSEACLTEEQINTAEKVYRGASRTDGTPYYAMGYAKGTELDWISGFLGVDGRPPRRAGSAQFTLERKIGPDATLADFDYAQHGATGSPVGGLLDFGPDGRKLKTFTDRGGKILLYHGWSDTDATPASSLFFYNAQANAFGKDALPSFLRLFMLPGMRHCRGGNGVHTTDYLTAMERWVERDDAPDKLVAYKTNQPWASFNYAPFPLPQDAVVAGRTLYPYPEVSVFDGEGDASNPMNWRKQ